MWELKEITPEHVVVPRMIESGPSQLGISIVLA